MKPLRPKYGYGQKAKKNLTVVHQSTNLASRTGCIEIQVRSNLDQGQFLALYLVRRTNFGVSCVLKILFAYTKDTSWGSLDIEVVSWFWFADTDFVYRARPCLSYLKGWAWCIIHAVSFIRDTVKFRLELSLKFSKFRIVLSLILSLNFSQNINRVYSLRI